MRGSQVSQPVSAPRAALVIAIAAIAIPELLTAERNTLHAQSRAEFVPVTEVMLQDPDPQDWIMWRRTLNGWGIQPS